MTSIRSTPSNMHHEAEEKDQPLRLDIASRVSKFDISDSQSVCSVTGEVANASFFKPMDRSAHTTSYSWKSPATHLSNEFARVQRMVRHVAPEQFRNPARPSNGPCSIVPTNLLEYVEHVSDILKLKTVQMEKNYAAKQEAARVKNIKESGEVQPDVKSKFGPDAKIYADGFSPVLCRATIWSAEHYHLEDEDPEWPTQVELQECGDRRENDLIATRCGRYLPLPLIKLPPRQDSSSIDAGVQAQSFTVKRLLPMDEPGPIFHNGPSPVEVSDGNTMFDSDPAFEEKGCSLLGSSLMADIGEWTAPYTPEWLAERRQREAYDDAMRMSQDQALWMTQYFSQ